MESALKLARVIDRISERFGKVVAWLCFPLVLALVYEVTARYGFKAPTEWAYDVTYMLYGTIFMLGAAFTLGYMAARAVTLGLRARTDRWMVLGSP